MSLKESTTSHQIAAPCLCGAEFPSAAVLRSKDQAKINVDHEMGVAAPHDNEGGGSPSAKDREAEG